jgi:urate oxidase
MTAPTMKYSSNGIVKYLNDEWIVLPETKEVLSYFIKIKNEYQASYATGDTNLSGGSTTAVNYLASIFLSILNLIWLWWTES